MLYVWIKTDHDKVALLQIEHRKNIELERDSNRFSNTGHAGPIQSKNKPVSW